MIVAVAGAELFYTTRGRGPVCLVLSTIGTKPYERQLPLALDEHLTLAFVDPRGSGRSTGTPADLDFDVLALDLEAVRQALGVERVAVFGHSILGALGVEYARRRPQSVSHVICAGTPPFGNMSALAAAADEFFTRDASAERKQILHDNMARLPPGTPPAHAMLAQTPRRFFDPRFDPMPLYSEADVRPAFLAHLLGKLTADWDIRTRPDELQVPLLIAHGRYDYTVPYTLWDSVLPLLPQATLELFARSGHQPFVEEPERFSQVLARWLSSPAELTPG
jgi:proline iminopeptidase